jgi:hypothetical protein
LGYGPSTWNGSLLPAAQQLLNYPPKQRPFFYWWFIECIPNPKIPTRLAIIAAKLRTGIDRRTMQSPNVRKKFQSMGIYRYFLRGFRFKILGELDYFRQKGLLDGLAITSHSRATYLQHHGFHPIVVPIGYYPELHGRDMGLRRDIDVGFLGNINSLRRFSLLEQVRKELEQRGITVSIQTNLYGEERTRFLNRTKINLNIYRAPYDFFGLRFVFCAANKALLISEPVLDYEPFIPGRHMVAVPITEIADTVEYYLLHEEKRQKIVDDADQLIHEEYTITQMIGRILDDARKTIAGR